MLPFHATQIYFNIIQLSSLYFKKIFQSSSSFFVLNNFRRQLFSLVEGQCLNRLSCQYFLERASKLEEYNLSIFGPLYPNLCSLSLEMSMCLVLY